MNVTLMIPVGDRYVWRGPAIEEGAIDMEDPEMNMVNEMFRQELAKFRGSREEVRRKVVAVVLEAGAYDWLIEMCEADDDPKMQDYARIAREMHDSDEG